MKKNTVSFLIAFALVFTTFGTAQAHRNDGLGELLIGAGSGAVIGQIIGRDVEGVVVGSVIGGALGLMIGLDNGHGVIVDRPRQVSRVTIVRHDRWEDRYDRWEHRRHNRYDRRWKRHHHRR